MNLAAVVGLICFLFPGVMMLAAVHTAPAESAVPPNWAWVLGGTLFTLFGAIVVGVALCQRLGANWRRVALIGMMLAFPATAVLLGWPSVQWTMPLGAGRTLAPGPADLLIRIALGVASLAFALASAVLWWLVLSGRVTSADVRGLGEE